MENESSVPHPPEKISVKLMIEKLDSLININFQILQSLQELNTKQSATQMLLIKIMTNLASGESLSPPTQMIP